MTHQLLLLCLLFGTVYARVIVETPGVSETLLPDIPFVSIWNVPSGNCANLGVNLNLSAFDIIANKKQKFYGSEMVIFYGSKLGLYPQYDHNTAPINGGLPQVNHGRNPR